MVIGAIMIKILQNYKFTSHQVMIVGASMIFIFSVGFNFASTILWLGINMILIGCGFCMFGITINVCMLAVSPSEQVEYWMMLGHGSFGIGGLFSPLMVYIFEINSYIVFGVLMGILVPFYWIIKTPEQSRVSQYKQELIPKERKVIYISKTL